METAKGAVAAVMRSRPWRANERLGQSRGAFLSAGIAFYGVFAIFPLLVLGIAVLGYVAAGNEELQDEVIGFVQTGVPGLIGPDGIVSEADVRQAAGNRVAFGVTAAVGVVTLLLTGLGWVAALREGIRAMFRMPTLQLDPVRAKLFDLAVLLTLGVLVVTTALASVVTTSVNNRILDLLDLEQTPVTSVLSAGLVALFTLLLDTLLFTVLYRVLAHTDAPLRQVVSGAVVAAIGTAVLRQLVAYGFLLSGNVGGGFTFLTAFVPILLLFVWLNLTARVLLFGASWVAVGPTAPAAEEAPETDTAPTPSSRRPAPPPLPPALPVRWADRAVLGAGVVLGASAVALLQATGAALRAVTRGVARVRED